MDKVKNALKWIISNFFFLPLAVLIVIYLRWFGLTPLMFFNDPDYAFIAGLILLGLYSFFTMLVKRSKRKSWLQILLLIPTGLLLMATITHMRAFFPVVKNFAKCNGKTYYITWMSPLGDYQWTFDNVTVWEGFFHYDSFFFTYSSRSYEIVCDEETGETNIVDRLHNTLMYTDGKNPRDYDEYVGTILGDHQYFLSRTCNDWVPSTCGSLTYTLYQCNLSYKSCKPLPIQYTQYEIRNFLSLASDETAHDVKLYQEDFETEEEILVFTWGKHPRCYVESCRVLGK